MKRTVLILGLLALIATTTLVSRSFRTSEIPHGSVKACANCHVNPGGGGVRNAFGREIERNFLNGSGAAGHVRWDAALAALDSDGDGFTNGQELQDPAGTWIAGALDPGDRSQVTNPGDPTSFPRTTLVERLDGTVSTTELQGNYPNPFNPSTTVRFDLARTGHTRLVVYDLVGAIIRTLVDRDLTAGSYAVQWDGRDVRAVSVPSGMYFYHLETAEVRQVRRMMLMK